MGNNSTGDTHIRLPTTAHLNIYDIEFASSKFTIIIINNQRSSLQIDDDDVNVISVKGKRTFLSFLKPHSNPFGRIIYTLSGNLLFSLTINVFWNRYIAGGKGLYLVLYLA